MKNSRKTTEEKEFDEMIRFECESGNPFAEGSYRSYKAKNRKKTTEKKENPTDENTVKIEIDEDLPF